MYDWWIDETPPRPGDKEQVPFEGFEEFAKRYLIVSNKFIETMRPVLEKVSRILGTFDLSGYDQNIDPVKRKVDKTKIVYPTSSHSKLEKYQSDHPMPQITFNKKANYEINFPRSSFGRRR